MSTLFKLCGQSPHSSSTLSNRPQPHKVIFKSTISSQLISMPISFIPGCFSNPKPFQNGPFHHEPFQPAPVLFPLLSPIQTTWSISSTSFSAALITPCTLSTKEPPHRNAHVYDFQRLSDSSFSSYHPRDHNIHIQLPHHNPFHYSTRLIHPLPTAPAPTEISIPPSPRAPLRFPSSHQSISSAPQSSHPFSSSPT